VLGSKIAAMLSMMGGGRNRFRFHRNGEKKISRQISIDGEVLMASDAPPGHFHQPQCFSSR